jgi:AcrR family transcriptional regulator
LAAETTRERILDAAEVLFAENGISATSVRAITAAANVNLASLNYHFGSKDKLVDAVFLRRVEPLNRRRIELLDEAEAQAGPEGPRLEVVLEALLGPAIRLALGRERGGEEFMRLMGRAHTESGDLFRRRIVRMFGEVFVRFESAFRRCLPELSDEDLIWCAFFVIGAMAHTMAHSLNPIRELRAEIQPEVAKAESRLSPQPAEDDLDVILARLIAFCAAGMRAEVVQAEKEAAR